jgi:hypothetical protein
VARNQSMQRLAMVCIGACLMAASYGAGGQQTTTANQVPTQIDFRCRHPADPHRRHYACDDRDLQYLWKRESHQGGIATILGIQLSLPL